MAPRKQSSKAGKKKDGPKKARGSNKKKDAGTKKMTPQQEKEDRVDPRQRKIEQFFQVTAPKKKEESPFNEQGFPKEKCTWEPEVQKLMYYPPNWGESVPEDRRHYCHHCQFRPCLMDVKGRDILAFAEQHRLFGSKEAREDNSEISCLVGDYVHENIQRVWPHKDLCRRPAMLEFPACVDKVISEKYPLPPDVLDGSSFEKWFQETQCGMFNKQQNRMVSEEDEEEDDEEDEGCQEEELQPLTQAFY